MERIINFDNRELAESTFKETWEEFRNELKEKTFLYDDISKAKESTFLKVFDDLFNVNNRIENCVRYLKDIRLDTTIVIGRGAKLKPEEYADYKRFIPEKDYINNNRFSPKGVEWLYLTINENQDIFNIKKCSEHECRAVLGNEFGFCGFKLNKIYDDEKIVDLTIYNSISFNALNEKYRTNLIKLQDRILDNLRKRRVFPNETHMEKKVNKWAIDLVASTYTKMLSDQIFIPIEGTDKDIEYAPFQTIAQYFISLGFSGIIYKSTVFENGKNLVLFDKNISQPFGEIEVYTVK